MPSSYVSGCTESGSPLDLKTKWNWLVGSVLPVRRLSLWALTTTRSELSSPAYTTRPTYSTSRPTSTGFLKTTSSRPTKVAGRRAKRYALSHATWLGSGVRVRG